jgi:hypothetical protein
MAKILYGVNGEGSGHSSRAREVNGAWWDELNKERIESFLFNLDLYRDNLKQYARQDNSALFAKLNELIGQFEQA